MASNLVTLSSTREAVAKIASAVRGRRITIRDVFANQNITREPIMKGVPVTPTTPVWIKKMLEPDCWGCISDLGLTPVMRSTAFADFRDGAKPAPPKNLDKCRKVLNSNIPTITLETDDETRISIAISQGCRGGWGVIRDVNTPDRSLRYSVIDPASAKTDGVRPYIQCDLNITPIHLEGIKAESWGMGGFSSTEDFWQAVKLVKMPVSSIVLETVQIGEIDNPALKFYYDLPKAVAGENLYDGEFCLAIVFNFPFQKGQKPFFWVDITKKGEETTRFMINGLRPLLFPEHFPGEF